MTQLTGMSSLAAFSAISALTLCLQSKEFHPKSCSGACLHHGSPAVWRSSGGPGFYYPILWLWSFMLEKHWEKTNPYKKTPKPESLQDLKLLLAISFPAEFPIIPAVQISSCNCNSAQTVSHYQGWECSFHSWWSQSSGGSSAASDEPSAVRAHFLGWSWE